MYVLSSVDCVRKCMFCLIRITRENVCCTDTVKTKNVKWTRGEHAVMHWKKVRSVRNDQRLNTGGHRYTYICRYIHIYISIYVYVHVCICTCVRVYIWYVCCNGPLLAHVYIYIRTRIYTHIYMYICIYICIYLLVYIHIYI